MPHTRSRHASMSLLVTDAAAGSARVFAEGEDRTRFVWIADLLPNERAGRIDELMDHGTSVIKKTLEAGAGRGS